MTTNTAPRTFSTDPGWYTDRMPEGVPAETLVQVYANAREAFYRAGGHTFAFQMQRVMENVKIEMHDRGLRPVVDPQSRTATAVAWIDVED